MEHFRYIIYLILFLNVTRSQDLKYARYSNEEVGNHKPIFKNCSDYKPTVKEEQDVGTYVITVRAVDNDPADDGGTITYKIVKLDGKRNTFSIDNVTGDIRTAIAFDRDEPNRQKELYVTVQATDNGRPALADICTIKVTVEDINDNQPSFDSSEFYTQVSEDTKPNSEVVRVLAYDLDDGNNSKLTYSFERIDDFTEFFRIDPDTGVVYLEKHLNGYKDKKFSNYVVVSDNGNLDNNGPLKSSAEISILVVGSDKRAPQIKSVYPADVIELKENFYDFTSHLVTIEANSSIFDKEVVFELIKGKTTQTNKDQTFLLTPSDKNENSAYITLVRALDYETVTEYTLTVRVKNKDQMDSSINIIVKVLDVNDEIPNFNELLKGSVVENDEAGQQAMRVEAVDKDGTSANNIVKYELLSHHEKFEIDQTSGIIKSKEKFDREATNLYHVKVRAYDNSPSALKNTTEPNSAIQTFQISVEDRNDNKPKFKNPVYIFDNIAEDSDVSKDVGEVKAEDPDTASLIIYSIEKGNTYNAFSIEETTGRIRVASKLDFEKIENYTLIVRAFDGIYADTAEVIINILNKNDEPPVFEYYPPERELREEELFEGCIINLKAYDPDIKNRSADQKIVFEVEANSKSFLDVDSDGCVRLIKPLDRDKPNGTPTRQVYISARDNMGGQGSLDKYAEILIRLTDINDNAPFLNVTEIVWYENESPGYIGPLSADDYDSKDNGPPFIFSIPDNAPDDIKNKFDIREDNILEAKVTFDREEQKSYIIPISISDSGTPPQRATSYLTLIIGDRNDNPAKDGESEIFVNHYELSSNDIKIGRVYVEDPDDWDLPDKHFAVTNSGEGNFYLDEYDNGMIMMKQDTPNGTYALEFDVTETNEPTISQHTVHAKVKVVVKDIIKEAVDKSCSIRVKGANIEDFVTKINGVSKKDILQKHISKYVNTSLDNVDVITILETPSNKSMVDVRFSAHGSPYYQPEKLVNVVTKHQQELERDLDVEFFMVGISECMEENACPGSCSNDLNISEDPALVFTNKSSFVGVKAIVQKVCECRPKELNYCFNGGTLHEGKICVCPAGFEGPHCENLGIGFSGYGWAMYPSLDACNVTEISLSINPSVDSGLVFYVGPLTLQHAQHQKDFMSLELENGYPVLKLNVGSDTTMVRANKTLSDGAFHKIKISYTTSDVQIDVDDCKSNCMDWKSIKPAGLLNVNGPLQLGGMAYRFNREISKKIWDQPPTVSDKFAGCIRNFTYNGFLYNLGAPSDSYKSFTECNYGITQAVTLGRDSLLAILICIAILLILMLALVVYKRKQDNLNEKDIDDTRENIINYEDEGGGECDTNYDLSVFRRPLDEKPPLTKDNPEADISGFLDTKKDTCDKDPDNLPYDDVRHYAYEGDGNSTGSLSSLASCTDEGDLNFSHLSNFGPRFRKLADMYGEEPSDEESQNGAEESWC